MRIKTTLKYVYQAVISIAQLNIDGGTPTSNYNQIPTVDGGTP